MRVGILFGILVFIAVFILFWNIKKWKWSVAKIVSLSLLCGVVSGGVVSALIYVLILIG